LSSRTQLTLFDPSARSMGATSNVQSVYGQPRLHFSPLRAQLLKWVGNKQRFARDIVSFFPSSFGTYFDPFLGSGAVLATLAPRKAIGSDSFKPLMEIWVTLKEDPATLVRWYNERYDQFISGDRVEQYERIKANYNRRPNGADLIFLCRSCYGGVVRFRQAYVHTARCARTYFRGEICPKSVALAGKSCGDTVHRGGV
jgi:DNA adenine methylase